MYFPKLYKLSCPLASGEKKRLSFMHSPWDQGRRNPRERSEGAAWWVMKIKAQILEMLVLESRKTLIWATNMPWTSVSTGWLLYGISGFSIAEKPKTSYIGSKPNQQTEGPCTGSRKSIMASSSWQQINSIQKANKILSKKYKKTSSEILHN